MVTHIFLNDPGDPEAKDQFNASVPSEDRERFARSIAEVAEKMTTYAGSAADPGEYGKLIASRLCPDTLPYELGTSAAFEAASFNGRALGDDAMDVILTLAANTPLCRWPCSRPRAHPQGFPVLWGAVYGGGAGWGEADATPGEEIDGSARSISKQQPSSRAAWRHPPP